MYVKLEQNLKIIKLTINVLLQKSKNGTTLILIIFLVLFLIESQSIKDIRFYKHYINLCKNLIKVYNNKEKKINDSPFFSICIPVYSMEKYIEKSFLSIFNQSFRDFEIVIINDYSYDNSKKIIENFQSENSQIRLINHQKNLGVFNSRVDAIRNSKGKYIIFLDPDDLFANPKLLEYLYIYNMDKNEDMIEFTVMIQEEQDNKIYYPLEHRRNHFHNFNDEIIYHPYLSNILFFENNKYSDIFCRCIWNKMVRKEILFKTINFLGNRTYNQIHFDFAEDTIINILNFEFSSNYSNLNVLGYMYNIRSDSMSHAANERKIKLKMGLNLFFYYSLFYKYIKHFNKDLNYLYFDIKAFAHYLDYIKKYSKFPVRKKPIIDFFKNIKKESNISYEFKKYAKNYLFNFIKDS